MAQPDPSTGDERRPGDRPPGTVAHEAALLLDLLARRTPPAAGMPSGRDAPPPFSRAASGTPDGEHQHEPGDGRPDESAHDCTCGGREPAACRVCPVCQVISFVQQVNPETIERVADLVGFAATALRDLATAQRERTAPASPDEGQEDKP